MVVEDTVLRPLGDQPVAAGATGGRCRPMDAENLHNIEAIAESR